MLKGLGWKPDTLDHRDRIYNAYPTQPNAAIDLRAFMPPVYDQGQTSSCVANATAAAVEYTRIKQSLSVWTPSRLFIYWNARDYEGTQGTDDGSQIRDGVKAVANIGFPPETAWPFDLSEINNRPSDAAFSQALNAKAIQYARVPVSRLHVLSCLTHNGPVIFGCSVFQSIYDPSVASTGYIQKPSPTDAPIGGHAMLLVGYEPSTDRFIIRNSWGDGWGEKGYGYMDASYVLNPQLSDDFWVVWLTSRS